MLKYLTMIPSLEVTEVGVSLPAAIGRPKTSAEQQLRL